jgi:uncharacterized protein YecA (UPF0149 family)
MTTLILDDQDLLRKMLHDTVAIGVLAGKFIEGNNIKQKQAISKKIPRNDPCPCGSGKKYKRCHYLIDDA